MEKQAGAVIVFRVGVSAEAAQRAIDALHELDLLEGQPKVREFDSEWGGPVWYIP
jgi:hypothetical protein